MATFTPGNELKDNEYDDEEFGMNEQSEDFTAVDCDSQADLTSF